MKTILLLATLTALTATAALKQQQGSWTYYIQLIRGSENDLPPQPGSKRVGPKLQSTFRSVFRLQSYWEIECRELTVSPGKSAKLRLNKERAVEIDLRSPQVRKVTAFQNDEPVDRAVRPVGEAMSIIGGNRDGKSVWFIVVRRDKPVETEKD
jgi:hypothetical protein